MKFIDKLFGKEEDWTPTHRCVLKHVDYDDLFNVLGKPKKSEDGFVYWRGKVKDFYSGYPDMVYYQISNKAFSNHRHSAETWFIVTNDAEACRMVANEVDGTVRNIEAF